MVLIRKKVLYKRSETSAESRITEKFFEVKSASNNKLLEGNFFNSSISWNYVNRLKFSDLPDPIFTVMNDSPTYRIINNTSW